MKEQDDQIITQETQAINLPQLAPEKDLLTQEIEHFSDALIHSTEQEILALLNNLVATYGIKQLNYFNVDWIRVEAASSSNQLFALSILAYAVLASKLTLVKRLIELGVNIEQGSVKIDDCDLYHNLSPLQIACQLDNLESVKLLVEHKANLLHLSATQVSILMETTCPVIAEFLLKEATRQTCLVQFVTHVSANTDSYNQHAGKGNIAILEKLFELKPCFDLIDKRNLLDTMRVSAWVYPQHTERFNNLCTILASFIPPYDLITFEKKQSVLSNNTNTLFGQSLPTSSHIDSKPSVSSNKKNSLLNALSTIGKLFNDPHQCLEYLRFLNDEFVRYCQSKYAQTLPTLDPSTYQFESIDGRLFPIPFDNYDGIKKYSLLQEFLILLFKNHGLANNSFKWVGFIPHKQADEMVKAGDFFTEGRIGAGLFHGKLSHMLQQAIILYAIEHRTISLDYEEQGTLKKLSALELLGSFVDNSFPRNWGDLRDSYVSESISFREPYRLNSFIMYHGKDEGLEALANYMIDTFCKGLKQFKQALETLNPAIKLLDRETFLNQLKQLNLRIFTANDLLNEYAVNQSVEKVKPNGGKAIDNSKKYAIIPTSYDYIDETFEPRSFACSP